MPRIRPMHAAESVSTLRRRLADRLVKELLEERLRDGPVIFEAPTGRDGEADVIVIWEAWRGLPSDERAATIRDAYVEFEDALKTSYRYIDPDKAADEPRIPAVSMAIGATFDEALAQGLLPYSIRPQVRPPHVDPEAMRQVMVEAGAIETPSGVQLRFPDAQLASESHARLEKVMPEAHWAINKEADSFDD